MGKSWVPGSVLLDKYRVEGELGQGGMGEVVRVTRLQLGEELAIKILSADGANAPGAHARFLREAQAAVRLRGEHVTRVTDFGVLPTGQPYMVMEYLRGMDLAGALLPASNSRPGKPSTTRCRHARRSPKRTPPGSYTATSSRRTCFSHRDQTVRRCSRSSTSACPRLLFTAP